MGSRKIEVAVVHGPFEAEVVRGLLESYGITARLASVIPHSLLPCLFDEPGRVSVCVDDCDAAAAEDLLARHRRSALALVRPADGGPDG